MFDDQREDEAGPSGGHRKLDPNFARLRRLGACRMRRRFFLCVDWILWTYLTSFAHVIHTPRLVFALIHSCSVKFLCSVWRWQETAARRALEQECNNLRLQFAVRHQLEHGRGSDDMSCHLHSLLQTAAPPPVHAVPAPHSHEIPSLSGLSRSEPTSFVSKPAKAHSGAAIVPSSSPFPDVSKAFTEFRSPSRVKLLKQALEDLSITQRHWKRDDLPTS